MPNPTKDVNTPSEPGSAPAWWDANPAKAASAEQARRIARRRRGTALRAADDAATAPAAPPRAAKSARRRALSSTARQTTAGIKARVLGLSPSFARVLAEAGLPHPALDPAPVGADAPAWAGSSCPDPDRQGALLGDRAAWYHAKTVSRLLNTPTDQAGFEDEKLRSAIRGAIRRHVRYAQREVLWRHSTLKRVRVCGRAAVGPTSQVVVKAAAGSCHYAGLASCGSIWACPPCSAKIRARRSEEISTAMVQWMEDGHAAYMVSLTMPHDLTDKLSPLIDTVIEGFRSLLSGRAFAGSTKTRRQKAGHKLEGPLEWVDGERQTHGIVGTIKAIEVTHGMSGWHPHAHVLVLTDKPLTAEQVETIHQAWYERWAAFVVKRGYRMPKWQGADGKHVGMDWRKVRTAKEAAEYIAKVQDGKVERHLGNELTRGDLKEGRRTGRTPFEVLEDFRWSADLAERAIWHEYEEATFRRNAITWSPGLKNLLLGIEDEDDPSDEDLAAEETGGDHMAVFERDDWRRVTRVPGLACAVLRAGETGGLEGIRDLVGTFGITVYAPDDPPRTEPETG